MSRPPGVAYILPSSVMGYYTYYAWFWLPLLLEFRSNLYVILALTVGLVRLTKSTSKR